MAPDIEPHWSWQRFKHLQPTKNFKNESERLKTFMNWTVSFLDSKKLAKGGFYCTNKQDAVKCAYCQVEIDSWEQGDIPEKKHKRLSPNCPLVSGEDRENQTQSESAEDDGEREEDVASEDVCGPRALEGSPVSASDRQVTPGAAEEQNVNKKETNSSRQRFQQSQLPRNLKNESERLKTFKNWTVSFLDSKKLAKGGFYYTNVLDVVKCAYCEVEIGCWEEGDVPEEEHKRHWPECPLLKRQSRASQTGREEEEEEEESNEEEIPSQDVCGPHELQIRPFSAPERPGKVPFAIESLNLGLNFEDIGVSKISRPVYPHYATYEARLKTFENWPIPEIQSPEKLAEAGFYYMAVADQVMCFHCGGGLHNWKEEDDPWVDHACWFRKCAYVILKKGREFINEVQAKDALPAPAAKGNENKTEVAQKAQTTAGTSTAPVSIAPSVSSSTSSSDKESQLSESPKSDAKEMELCRICYIGKREIVFLPCGHFISCTQCALFLSKCAVCRKPFEAFVRAYLS